MVIFSIPVLHEDQKSGMSCSSHNLEELGFYLRSDYKMVALNLAYATQHIAYPDFHLEPETRSSHIWSTLEISVKMLLNTVFVPPDSQMIKILADGLMHGSLYSAFY